MFSFSWGWGGGYNTFRFHSPSVFYILSTSEVLLTKNWVYAKRSDFEEMTENGNLLTSCTAPGAWK